LYFVGLLVDVRVEVIVYELWFWSR